MAFDPDAYIASLENNATPVQAGGFDPDAYIASLSPQQSTARQEGRAMNSSFQGGVTALQGPTLGFMDELAGVGSAITGGIANLTPWGDDKTMVENYISGRDKVRGMNEQYSQDYPKTAIGSQIAASMPVAAVTKIAPVTGFIPKVVQAGRIGGQYGAVGGLGSSEADTAAGVIEDTGKGAVVGGVLGVSIAGGLAGGAKLAGWVNDTVRGSGAYIKAGHILRSMAGQEKGNIEAILNAADSNQTTGQALANAGGGNRDELLALATIGAKKGDPNAIRALQEAQAAVNKAVLARASGGVSEEASIAAQKAAHTKLNLDLDPMRIKGADAANRNTKMLEMLRQKAEQYAGKAAEKSGDVRRMLSVVREDNTGFAGLKVRASERANTTYPIEWMPRVAGKYTYMGELANKAEQVATKSASDSLKAGASANVAKNLSESIEARGISTLSAKPLFNKIDSLVAKEGDRANPVLTKTLNGFKEHAQKFVDKNGNIDAYDLHQLRKNANDLIDTLFPNADQQLKNRAGAVLTGLKPTIDDGLKAAGGGDLVKYFDEYSSGINVINRMKMGAAMQKLTPDELINLTKGNNTKLVEDIFGTNRTSFSNQMGDSAKPIHEVAKRLEADALLANRGNADAAQNAAAKILEKDMIGFRLPAYMDAKAYTANLGLSKFEKFLNEKTREVLFKAMQNPKQTVELMNTLPSSERVKFLKALQDPQLKKIMAAQAGMTQAVQDE